MTGARASDRHANARKPLCGFRRADRRECEIERGARRAGAQNVGKEKWQLSGRLEQIRHQRGELSSIGFIDGCIVLRKKCLQRHVRAFQQNAVIDAL